MKNLHKQVLEELNEPIDGHPSRIVEQKVKNLEKIVLLLAENIENQAATKTLKEIQKPKKVTAKLIFIRIIGFPFFALFGAGGAVVLWFKWIFNYSKYGGEAITYTSETRAASIQDVFNKLVEIENSEKIQS